MTHWEKVLPADIHEVCYEDLIADHEGTSPALVKACGVVWDPVCLAFHEQDRAVLSASDWQVRQPIYSRSLGRWKNYQKHLGTLASELRRS